MPGAELDEIKEVTEHEGGHLGGYDRVRRAHRRPKVIASNDAFSLEESPRPSAMRVQVNKVIPNNH